MVADNAARMNRFRALPHRGRLAVLVLNAPQFYAAVDAIGPSDPKFGANLARAIRLGEQTCVGKLTDAGVREIDPLINSIVSLHAEWSRFVVTADDSPSANSDVLREAAHLAVRMLLAVKSLQSDSYGDASIQLDEGFHSMLEYLDEVVDVVSPSFSAEKRRRLLNQRFTRVDAQLEQMAAIAEKTRPDSSGLLTGEVLNALKQTGRNVDRLESSGVPSDDLSKRSTAGAATAGPLDTPKKKGLGIGAIFIILALVKAISRMDGCGQGPQKAARPDPPQVREEPVQQKLGMALQNLNNVEFVQRVQATLTEAEEATAAGNAEAAATALQRASADLANFTDIDLLDDGLARVFVRLSWMCADMMRPGNQLESLSAYDTGILAARKLLERSETMDDRSVLAALLNNKAVALQELGRSPESLELLTEAEELQSAALESDPSNEQYRTFLSHHYDCLMDVNISLKQWQQAIDAADCGRGLWTTQSESLFNAACRFSHLATAIRDCPDDVPDRDRMVGELVGQALEALRAARGPDLDLAAEIQQNEQLKILETVTPEDPKSE